MNRSLLQQVVLYEYRYLIGYTMLFFLTIYAMFWRLGTLLPGLHAIEIEQATLSNDLSTLINNPLDPIFRVMQWLSFQVSPDPLIAARLAGAVFGAATVYMMYRVLTLKFSARIAIVTSLVFTTSSWLLSYARFGHPAISTVFLITALMYVSYKAYESRTMPRFALVALVAGLGVYHRWFVYFLIIGIFVSMPILIEMYRHINRRVQLIVSGFFILLLLPLIVACVRDPELLRTLLNIPDSVPSLSTLLDNSQAALAQLFWQAREFPALYLGTIPMLDIFSAAMVALGLYHLDHEISKTLSRFVLVSFGMSFVLLTINPDPFVFAVLIPFTYILLAAGFIMLVGQWNEIFPKNPIARTVAFIPLTILVCSVIAYHNERYFLAWPRTPEVIQQYPESIGRLNAFVGSADENIIVIGTSNEAATYEIVTRTYDEVQFIEVDQQINILSAQTAIVTPEANKRLPESLREQLPEKRTRLSSSSSFEPTLFIVYSRE